MYNAMLETVVSDKFGAVSDRLYVSNINADVVNDAQGSISAPSENDIRK